METVCACVYVIYGNCCACVYVIYGNCLCLCLCYIWKLFVLVFMLYRETVCACVNVNNAQFLDHVCVVVYTLTANINKI